MFARLRELFRPRPARLAIRPRPTLECLEDRTAPATFTGVTPTFGFGSGVFGGSGFGSAAAGFGLGNPGFGVGGAPTTSLNTFGLGLGVPGFGTTTQTVFGIGLGTTGFGTGTAGFGVGPLGLGSTAAVGAGSTMFGPATLGFGLTTAGLGLATPANIFTQGPNLNSFGLGLGTPAFAAAAGALGLNAPSFTAFGTPQFGLNTPGIELNTFGLGLGNSALGTNPTNFGISGSLPFAGLGGASLDASLLTTFAQVIQQAIALEQQAAQQAFSAALQAFGTALLTNDTNLLGAVQPILQQLGVTLPALNAQSALNSQAITLLNSNPTPNQFAAASINQQLQGVQLLQAEVTAGANLPAINFAVASLPTVGSDLLTALQFQQNQLGQVV